MRSVREGKERRDAKCLAHIRSTAYLKRRLLECAGFHPHTSAFSTMKYAFLEWLLAILVV